MLTFFLIGGFLPTADPCHQGQATAIGGPDMLHHPIWQVRQPGGLPAGGGHDVDLRLWLRFALGEKGQVGAIR